MREAYETVLELLSCMNESGRLDVLDLVDLLKGGLMVVVGDLGLNGQTVLTAVSFRPRKPTVTATSETGSRCFSVSTNVKTAD